MPLFGGIKTAWEKDYGMVVKNVDPSIVVKLKRYRECRGKLTYDNSNDWFICTKCGRVYKWEELNLRKINERLLKKRKRRKRGMCEFCGRDRALYEGRFCSACYSVWRYNEFILRIRKTRERRLLSIGSSGHLREWETLNKGIRRHRKKPVIL